jgi:hypothetical protein
MLPGDDSLGPVNLNDEKPDTLPTANPALAEANAEIARLRSELSALEGPSGFGNCTALQGLTLLGKVQKCMRVIRGDRDAEAAESLRKQVASLDALNTRNREARATHRCKICDAKWIHLPDGYWTLASKTCGPCCDNAPMAGRIEPVGLTAELEAAHAESAKLLDEIATLRAELAARTERAEKAEFALRGLPEANDDICDRLDAAQKELEGLRARKVKLPASRDVRGFHSHETTAEERGYNDALEDCATAIRAAGISIEGE